MENTLKPYPEYKESGLSWLGQMPTSWEIARTKTCFRLSTEKSGKLHGKELLSVYTHIGVRPRKDLEAKGNKATTTDDYWVVRRGDIIVNKLLAWMGAVGVSHFDGVTSPAYDILRPVKQMEPDYYHFLFRTKLYLQLFKSRSRGIMDMRLRLYFDQLGQIPLIIPPLEQQSAIVRFLDYENARIEKMIRLERSKLTLVSELLLGVTQQAMQESSSRNVRLSVAAEMISRPIERSKGQNYTPVGLYNRGRGIFHKQPTDGSDLGDSEFFRIEDGDLVISGQFAWEGAVALARIKDAGCVASHRYPILRGRPNYVSSPFLVAMFRTRFGAMLLDAHSRGAAGRNRPLNARTLLKEIIPIPSQSTQAHISSLLDKEYEVSQSLAKTIRLINEFRARLITDVVTGKLDVRKAAKDLPEEPDKPENIEKIDDVAEDEVADEV